MSVNVGMPKDVSWRGKTVFTGVFKEIAGHRSAARGESSTLRAMDRAISPGTAASSARSSSTRSSPTATGNASWNARASSHGQFGENFTIEGLARRGGVHRGPVQDRRRDLRGDAAPRDLLPRRHPDGTDPRIPALLVSHHRPGFYFRVIDEGDVEAGDEIVKLVSGPEELTVADAQGTLDLPGHPRQQLLRALRIPALSPGWQASFRAMLSADASDRGNAGSGWRARRPPGRASVRWPSPRSPTRARR